MFIASPPETLRSFGARCGFEEHSYKHRAPTELGERNTSTHTAPGAQR